MAEPPFSRSPGFAHLGLVAGLCDDLARGAVLEHAPPPHPERRDLTGGEAGNAMVRKGLGVIQHALSLVPRFFQKPPPARLLAPRVAPEPLHDAARGRPVAPLSDAGGTARDRRLAAPAAARLGLAPRVPPRARPSVPGEGRENRAAAPSEHGVHLPTGESRAPRPNRTRGMLALIVAPQAGSPVRLTPRRGQRREGHAGGHSAHEPLAPWHTTDDPTSLVADRAR